MSTKRRIDTKSLTRIAVFAALLAICSQISIPMPSGVPITLQTFAVSLIGYTLSKRDATLAVVVYLLLGAVGIPVFAGFKGGAMLFVGLTGGFLIGFIPVAWLTSIGKDSHPIKAFLWGMLGMVALFVIGTIQFSLISGTPIGQSVMMVAVPFIPKDIVTVVIAYIIGKTIRQRLPL